MRASAVKYVVLTITLSLLCVVLALVPFHAFGTIWASQQFDANYTILRLWKEFLVALAAVGVLYLLLFDQKVRFHTSKRRLTWLIVAYLALLGAAAVWAWVHNDVTAKAAAYGVLLQSRYLVFFLLAWAVAVRTQRFERRWPKLLFWPAAAVVVFGLLQVFVLPADFLRHFGYGPDTIKPIATINNNLEYQRYFSTLRGPNPLGAYLLLPIAALTALLLRNPKSWNWLKGTLLAGSVLLLFFSHSRSAWIGATAAITTVLLLSIPRQWLRRHAKKLIGATLAGGLITVGLVAALWSDPAFQNALFHTEDASTVVLSSNDQRASALHQGMQQALQEPLGRGPGTAGPASVYNQPHPVRLAENYYLQTAQEIGLLGLGLFVAILLSVGNVLWDRRSSPLALALFASLIGISIVNLLSHAWTDDTLAYVWWGLAGIAVGTRLTPDDETTT